MGTNSDCGFSINGRKRKKKKKKKKCFKTPGSRGWEKEVQRHVPNSH